MVILLYGTVETSQIVDLGIRQANLLTNNLDVAGKIDVCILAGRMSVYLSRSIDESNEVLARSREGRGNV